MKAINIKFASFTFAAMLLASCSDSNDGPGATPTNPDVVGKEVTSITDAQTLAARVNNYKSVKTSSRAAGVTKNELKEVYSMESEPTGLDFTNMKKLSEYKTWEMPKNENLLVAENETVKKANYHLDGNTIYVKGVYEYDPSWTEGNYTIVVLPGGTLKWDGGNLFPNNKGGKILCYGTIECNADLDVQNNGIFKVAGDLNLKGHKFSANNASTYIGGKLICNDFANGANAYTNIQGGIEGLEDKNINIEGIVNVDGNVKLNNLNLKGSGQLYCCSLELSGDFTSEGGDGAGSALHTSYLKAKQLLLKSSNHIYLVNNSSIEVEGTLQCNKNASAMVTLVGDNAKAYIKAKTIKYNGSGSPSSLRDCYIFNATGIGGEFWLDIDNVDDSATGENNLAFSDVNWEGSGKTHNYRMSDSPITLEPAKCGYNIVPQQPGKHLDEIGTITYDHTHDISATCIQPYNGKLYMSYHTRGNGHGGCIEVFETDNQNQTKLLQFLQDTENSLDFNHLMIDSKPSTPNLYVVGNYSYDNKTTGKQAEAGAMLARIDLNSNGLLNTEVKHISDAAINPLIIVPLENESNNEDENAIVRDGDKLLVTSTRGYEVYDPNTLELLSSKKTPGKAKHIALNNNEIATLYYNNRNLASVDTPVSGTLELFNAGADITTATPNKSIAISEIAPNNGKNTIAIDGNNIYVCRSANGLTCYDRQTGAEKWTWAAPFTATTGKRQGYANGVTFDSNYIYLACGGYGLIVLDKNKMEDGKPAVVAKTRVTGVTNDKGKIVWNSANYVTLYNGLIYVAYGKNRLHIYKLVDGSVSGSAGDTTKTETKK